MTMSDQILEYKLLMRKPTKKLTVDNTTIRRNKLAIKHATTSQQQKHEKINQIQIDVKETIGMRYATVHVTVM